MRIWAQLPSQRPTNVVAPQAYLDLIGKITHPDTEVSFHALPPGPSMPGPTAFGFYGIRYLNDRQILRAVARAEAENYDAAVIICYFDPGVRAAKQLLSVPVVGVAEASMLLASMMGLRFAVVTSDARFVDEMAETLRLSGMTTRAIESRPVRPINLDEAEFQGCLASDVGMLLEDFTAVAKGCIKDGAEVIISGCTLMASFLSRAGINQIQGAPVIDPILTGIKMAELMVDLKRAGFPVVSRRGFFEEVPAQMLEQAKASGLF